MNNSSFAIRLRGSDIGKEIVLSLIYVFSLILLYYVSDYISFSLIAIIVCVMNDRTICIKYGNSQDFSNVIVSPISSHRKILQFVLNDIISINLILPIIFIVMTVITHIDFKFPVILNIILVYIAMTVFGVIIVPLARRNSFFSVFFKLLSPLLVLLVIPFVSTTIHFQYVDIVEYYYVSYSFTFFLLFAALLFWFMSIAVMKLISTHCPFPKQTVIKNYNKNYWY